MEKNLQQDMQDSQWFKDKIRASDTYAQNVYAALCNMQWQPLEVIPILKDETWACTWRSAGGIVADLRSKGEDYMDFYCSGGEGIVQDDIAEDFARIGWHWSEWPKDK